MGYLYSTSRVSRVYMESDSSVAQPHSQLSLAHTEAL